METILAAAFGRVIEVQKGQSDQLTKAASAIFATAHENKMSSIIFLTTLLSKSFLIMHSIKATPILANLLKSNPGTNSQISLDNSQFPWTPHTQNFRNQRCTLYLMTIHNTI